MRKSPLPKDEMNNREAINLWLYFFLHGKVGADTIWTVYRGVVNGQQVIKRRLRGRNHVEIEYIPSPDRSTGGGALPGTGNRESRGIRT